MKINDAPGKADAASTPAPIVSAPRPIVTPSPTPTSTSTPGPVVTPTPTPTAVAAPTFSVPGGTYNNNESVTLSTTTSGATILYCTTASCTPSTLYSSAITVSASGVIRAMATLAGLSNSTVSQASYTLTVAAPVVSPGAGTYNSSQSVMLSSATSAATFQCCTGAGCTSYTACTSPVSISATTTLRVRALKTGYATSASSGDLNFVINLGPPPANAGLIANHLAVQNFSKIPARYLTAAKALTLHYAHTSHGSQIIDGALALESANSTYSLAVRESTTAGLPPAETPAALRIYDGNPGDTYVTPERYWSTSAGRGYTQSVVQTGQYNFSMWSWCGQQSGNDTATVQSYLNTMLNWEKNTFTSMRFILMTGHTDGTNTPNTPGTLKYNNALVRQFAANNNMVVYDFEDIESYDPAGNYYPYTDGSTDNGCTWCTNWCSAHPADCTNVPDSCAHTHPFNCVIKAKAFWWMMSRLAGWDGVSP